MDIVLTEKAKELGIKPPKQGTVHSAGFDLQACIDEPIHIFANEIVKIPTGIKVWQPNDNHSIVGGALIYPRSSNPDFGGLMQLANTIGLVDEDYQGEIFVKVWNAMPERGAVTIRPLDRFAQIAFTYFIPHKFRLVESFDVHTERHEYGFGSTGKV